MLDLSSNPNVDDVVVVVVDAANHANLEVDAIFSLVDGYADGLAILHLVGVAVVLFLGDVVVQLSDDVVEDGCSSLMVVNGCR